MGLNAKGLISPFGLGPMPGIDKFHTQQNDKDFKFFAKSQFKYMKLSISKIK